MIPSVVAPQLQDTLVDYVLATLDLSDPSFERAFEDHLRGPDGLFRGPYLRLGLPFRTADAAEPVPLTVGPPFTPYAHQVQAFRQLDTGSPQGTRNTLVTTGTGSGKTECFQYPILDHCFRHPGSPGIKAIVVYPMNALATDQARRLAEVIHADARLRGRVTAGLYVGGADDSLPGAMGPDHVIEHRRVLRNQPPDILLTNYKMLDFMLLRPDERSLWQHNAPETLRFLVVDELHTFDGAQGSDVGCLIRRLKARLSTPEGHLACVGTSATIGSATEEDTFERLATFASEVFGEPFQAGAVVREARVGRATFLLPPAFPPLPKWPHARFLRPEVVADPDSYRMAQEALWLGETQRDAVTLGDALRAHPMLDHLLAVAAERPTTFHEVDERIGERVDDWRGLPPPDRQRLLTSFLALVSSARRRVGSREVPLVTVQVQLWARELTRLLRSLPDQRDGALAPASFGWWSDLPDQRSPEGGFGPQAHCRECGIAGFAAVQTDLDRATGKLTLTPSTVGEHWLRRHRDARFVWPRPLDDADRQGEAVFWLDPETATLHGKPPLREDGSPRGAPVRLEERTVARADKPARFHFRCPACDVEDALSIVGARSASLTSVAVTHLYQSPFNTDRKLLAFTDSVQDATHRAGFFGGRTFRIHLRIAIQAVIAEKTTLPLARVGEAFEVFWRARLGGDVVYVASFLPPDLQELPEVVAWREAGPAAPADKVREILRRRIAWEITREFGVTAGIGRSLERSAASVAGVDPDLLGPAAERFAAWVGEQSGPDERAEPRHFLVGLLHRLRHMGAVFHPYLEAYVHELGNRFLLSKQKNPHFTPTGPQTRRIRFLSERAGSDVFPSPFGSRSRVGWFGDWVRKALAWPDPSPDDVGRVYRRALDQLVEARILAVRKATGGVEVWGLDPAAVLLSAEVGAVSAGVDGRVTHLAPGTAAAADGKPSWTFRETARFRQVPTDPGYYARVYGQGSSTRVFPAEHTGLLEREERTTLERRFLVGPTPDDPQAPNLIVATPTLELGVDIGDLSAAMLCSVPPTPSNYLQRVGRAGRKTGNALVFVMANAQPHDLYFHASPPDMLDGVIHPPGVFLGAVAVLRRQLTAWCMDRWAKDDAEAGPIPRKAGLVLGELGRARFPGRLVDYVRTNREALVVGFFARFADQLHAESRELLEAWIRSEGGLVAQIPAAFDDLAAQIREYQLERERAQRRIKQIEEDPTSVADAAQELRDLKRYRAVVGDLVDQLRRRYPLEVLAEASLLPNYAFPEAGVHLHSLLGTREQGEDGREKRTYEQREYVRPAARALRELAPFNTFYALGHRVEIRQVELGPRASRVQHWRFCPTCHHRSRAVDRTLPANEPCCPRCGDPAWADKGQIRPMLPMTTVRSVADRVNSTAVDETEERVQERYHVHQVFELAPEHLDGEAVLVREVGFGFEYSKRVTLTEINLGLESALEAAPKVKVANETASADGFATCRDCGTVLDPRPKAAFARATPEHSPFCPQRSGDTKPRESLWLFREVTSEAVRFLLPFVEVQLEPKLRSFEAAVAFGLRRRFRGRPMHLQIATMSEPVALDRDRRKHFLVLFDAVPGGTGYLREFRHRRAVFQLLETALEGLRQCPCRARGRDGCYLCLFAHQRQRYLPLLSSRLAEDWLARILDQRHLAEIVPGLSAVESTSAAESEFEEKAVVALQVRYGEAFRPLPGGKSFELRAGATTWRLDAQVDLSAEAGEPVRADLVFTAISGQGLEERVVVECDGFEYHALPQQAQARIAADLRKRQALASRPGWRVFTLTWHDLKEGVEGVGAPAAMVGVPNHVWSTVFNKASSRFPPETHQALAQLPRTRPFDLLCAYLEHPGDHWRAAMGVVVSASLASAAQQKELVDGHGLHRLEDHLRRPGALAPLPPYGLVSQQPRNTDLWGRISGSEDCAALVVALGKDIARFDPDAVRVLVRLDDRQERRAAPGFVTSWRQALHALNLAQFLGEAEILSSEALLADSPAEELDVLGAIGLAADPSEPPAYKLDPELVKALKACLDDPARDVVRAGFALGFPPDTEPGELPGGAPAEVTWAALRVAAVREDDLEPMDLDRARQAGWNLLRVPVDPAELARALRATTRAT